MNAIDWLTATADFMHRDRPDIYKTVEDAFAVLESAYSDLSDYPESGWCSFGGFLLHKHVEDDEIIEYHLTKKISNFNIFPKEHAHSVYGFTENSGTLKSGVDLPGPFV